MGNSADPDQTPQNAASDQGLYCLQIALKRLFRESGLFIVSPLDKDLRKRGITLDLDPSDRFQPETK